MKNQFLVPLIINAKLAEEDGGFNPQVFGVRLDSRPRERVGAFGYERFSRLEDRGISLVMGRAEFAGGRRRAA